MHHVDNDDFFDTSKGLKVLESGELFKKVVERMVEALEDCETAFKGVGISSPRVKAAIVMGKQLVKEYSTGDSSKAEVVSEPVAYWDGKGRFTLPETKEWLKFSCNTTLFGIDIPLYSKPQSKSSWIGLTNEEAVEISQGSVGYAWAAFETERILKKKNTCLKNMG